MQTGEKDFTPLIPKIGKQDPDDAFSSVPYERGSAFLFYLETVVAGGDVAAFENFLKAYIHRFSAIDDNLDPQIASDRTLSSQDFHKFFTAYWGAGGDGANAVAGAPDALKKVNWAAWFRQAGMPPVDCTRLFDSTMLEECTALAERWRSRALSRGGDGTTQGSNPFSSEDMADWESEQKVAFVERLLDPVGDADSQEFVPWTAEDLAELDSCYGLRTAGSFEIRFRWLKLCVAARAEEHYDSVIAFATSQGRMKFTRPLFRALFGAGEKGAALAVEAFKAHRNNFHNICSKMVARDLGL
jgi:leukotriene-A4 hydrolase